MEVWVGLSTEGLTSVTMDLIIGEGRDFMNLCMI